jgi:tetratricopeptide (TPR) repeat protein
MKIYGANKTKLFASFTESSLLSPRSTKTLFSLRKLNFRTPGGEATFGFRLNLLRILGLFCLFSFFGCGTAVVTQESAQRAVYDAQSAVQQAKSSRADLYSTEHLNEAERFLNEAEQSLLLKRRQRAYSFATKAAESAKLAEAEAKQSLQRLQTIYPFSQFSQPFTPSVPGELTPYSTTQPFASLKGGPYGVTPFQQGYITPPNLPAQEQSLLEMQNRIQAAAQALQNAQNAMQTAWMYMLKIQTEIGLSMANTIIQQARESGAKKEMIDLIQSWYNQAQQAAAMGDYEKALRFIERAQIYAIDAQTLSPK